MRILIANDQHWPLISGVATSARTLAQSLARNGHDVLVVAPSQTGRRYKEVDHNYQIVRTLSLPFPFRNNYRLPVTWQNDIKKIIQEFNPDIIHIQTQYPVGLTALKMAKKLSIPVVATNHAMPENIVMHFKSLEPLARPIQYVLKEYGLLLYKDAEHIIMPTQSAIDLLQNSNIKIPMTAVSNGVELRHFKPANISAKIKTSFGLPTDRPIIMYVGRLDGEKHVHILIEAMSRMLKQTPAHLAIVGGGAIEESLQDLAFNLGISENVTFTGRVSDEDLLTLHQASDIFAMPSPAELQCLALLESMATGKPAVAVRVGALPELCQEGRNGFLVNVDDPEAMADKLTLLVKDKKLRKEMGQESLKIAAQHDMKHVLKQFEKIYTEVIKKHKNSF